MKLCLCILIALYLAAIPLTGTAMDEREYLGEEIVALAHDLSCDLDSECRAVGFGNRVCGGFSEYIIYSTKSVDYEYIETLSSKYYELDKQHNLETGGSSICSITQPRVSACIYSKCIDLGDKLNAITPLHWAVVNKDIDLIYKLVQQGVDIDIQAGTFGDTPLQLAIRRNLSFELIKLLVDLGANINASKFPIDTSRNTPLHIAVYSKRYDLIKYLLDQGANKSAGTEIYSVHVFRKTFKRAPQI